MYCGVRFEIGAELQGCMDREHAAEREWAEARSTTRAVLDRMLVEVVRDDPLVGAVLEPAPSLRRQTSRDDPKLCARLKR
jgi:hypothetical protein